MIQQILGALETFGQFFTDRLFDDAGTGKADQGVRFGDLHIAQHGIGCCHPARGRMGQHHDVRQPRFLEHLHRNRCARHLHQTQNALLHAGSTGCGKEDQRGLEGNRPFSRRHDGIAHIHGHGPPHEGKILHRNHNLGPPHLAFGNQHRVFFTGLLARFLDPVRIAFLIAEMQRVDHRFGHCDLYKNAVIENRPQPVPRADCHVVIAVCADIEVVRQFTVKQHCAAIIAFGPKIVGHFTSRKQRVDRGADVVGDPVHVRAFDGFASFEIGRSGAECNQRCMAIRAASHMIAIERSIVRS